MDKRKAIAIAQRYATVVKSNFDYDKIILFGSYSKGNFDEHSDIDIAVVFDDYDNHIQRQVELLKLTRYVDSRIEPHPFREKDFNINNPLAYEILSSGEELHV
ncbi:MAG: nucleotidyltransferase domain-containing protein [Prevotellaceae bacterium]|jgi:predicted nucleotidyltransferase|nr:nucleotidyltransferase domain-containing protein [Prevotellaceae bacterium]